MARKSDVILTAAEVAKKREQAVKLKKEIAKKQAEAAEINAWLEAASVIMGGLPQGNEGEQEEVFAVGSPPESMTEAVERLVRAAPKPLPKAVLKRLLQEEGFPPEKLDNYFYTVLKRLKDKQKIMVMKDGSVAIGPSILFG